MLYLSNMNTAPVLLTGQWLRALRGIQILVLNGDLRLSSLSAPPKGGHTSEAQLLCSDTEMPKLY